MPSTTTAAEGVTAASGTVSGAIIGGGIGGPAGAAVGAVIGAAAGVVVGYSLAHALNASEQDAFWRTRFSSRPYVTPGAAYEDYREAYRYGWETAPRDRRGFDEAAADLERGWQAARLDSQLPWAQAREAVRDAWRRSQAGNARPDADRR